MGKFKRFPAGTKALVEVTFAEGDDYGDACWVFLPTEGITNTKPRLCQIERDRVHPMPQQSGGS